MLVSGVFVFRFFFQAEGGIRVHCVAGVQTCALPIFFVFFFLYFFLLSNTIINPIFYFNQRYFFLETLIVIWLIFCGLTILLKFIFDFFFYVIFFCFWKCHLGFGLDDMGPRCAVRKSVGRERV